MDPQQVPSLRLWSRASSAALPWRGRQEPQWERRLVTDEQCRDAETNLVLLPTKRSPELARHCLETRSRGDRKRAQLTRLDVASRRNHRSEQDLCLPGEQIRPIAVAIRNMNQIDASHHLERECVMTKVRVAGFSISLDGFGAGPDQSLENPLSIGFQI